MSRIESGFIPLPKVEQEQPEDTLEIRLNLPPYVDQDRIGVNPANIVKLNNWGGIRTLRIVGRQGDTSTEIPEITGINSEGSALASKKTAKVEVPTFESFSGDYGWNSGYIANRWRDVGINLNVDEMAHRVKEQSESVRSSHGWARMLDSGIKDPIRKEGHKNLLHELKSDDKYTITLDVAIASGINLMSYVVDGRFAPFAFAGVYVANRLVALVRTKANSNYRFSLFPGYQVDRAAILSITSRIKAVVKDLHETK